MSLPLAALLVALTSILTNRILAMGMGLWFHVPAALLMGLLLFMDIIQIPVFYRIYEHGSSLLDHLPVVRNWMDRDWSKSALGKWAMPLGGVGVMLVAALPTFGGGMWSATFVAYGLKLQRRVGYAWMVMGSFLSYSVLYWVLDTVIRTIRYFT